MTIDAEGIELVQPTTFSTKTTATSVSQTYHLLVEGNRAYGGYGNGCDFKRAFECFQLAMEQGDACGTVLLAQLYHKGDKVDKNEKMACQLCEKAKEMGLLNLVQSNLSVDPIHQYAVGFMYERGYGVPKDQIKAIEWYLLSAAQHFAPSQYKLGLFHRTSSNRDISEARKWTFLAADQGLARAEHARGMMLVKGRGVPRNTKEALEWFHIAANQGVVNSQYVLGCMYKQGEGVTQDSVEAAKWYGLAAVQGLLKAQYTLGMMHQQGTGVSLDLSRAVMLYYNVMFV
jgi:TPR repeat protein